MVKATPTDALERIVIRAAELAQLLDVSECHIWALNNSGKLPRPVRLGRRVLWNRAEIEAWIGAGAPARDRWEVMRGT